MPRPRKDYCPYGHHKPTTGYAGSNGRSCRLCAQRNSREWQRRRRARLYGGPLDFYGEQAPREPLTRLRDIRLSLGLTQRQLAYRSGITQGSLSKLELGRTCGYPSTRAKLIAALEPLLRERRERWEKAGLPDQVD